MKVSVCITTLNEEGTIGKLLESLINQTRKPDEIVIVDGGSTDKTLSVIYNFSAYAKASVGTAKIKLVVSEGSSIAKGRNVAIKSSKYPIIAMTDAGCICEKHWFDRITRPFENKETEIVAGFYKMSGKTHFQKALMPFLGIMPENFDKNFLPSTRSIAFSRGVFKKIGKFSEGKARGGEDTLFNYKAHKNKIKLIRVKNAKVTWEVPKSIHEAFKKFYNYAKWDAQSKIIWNPAKGTTSHNIKVILVFVRYLLGLSVIVMSLKYGFLIPIWVSGLIIYLIWSFFKTYKYFKNFEISLWGIGIQILADVAVMSGFIFGIVG